MAYRTENRRANKMNSITSMCLNLIKKKHLNKTMKCLKKTANFKQDTFNLQEIIRIIILSRILILIRL